MRSEYGYWMYPDGKSYWGMDVGPAGGLAVTASEHALSDPIERQKAYQAAQAEAAKKEEEARKKAEARKGA